MEIVKVVGLKESNYFFVCLMNVAFCSSGKVFNKDFKVLFTSILLTVLPSGGFIRYAIDDGIYCGCGCSAP